MEELIFTSSSRGLQVGKSGFCTVAATAGMSPGLIRMLESLSGYRHLFAPGTPEAKNNPVAYSYVKAKVGNDFRYVLSRVKDCGKDYSGRSNKIAHHLSLKSNFQNSSPTRTLLEKRFFADQWDKPAAHLPPRELPGKFSKPSACSYWQKVTGDAGWAGELIESCQMNKLVYLIIKPSTPVMGLIHQAISLLPADQQWQYTFCTFYRQMPPNVECQIRCVMQNSPEIELTRQSSNNVLIDLTKPLGKSLSHWAQSARTGTLIEGQPPVVEQMATSADIDRNRASRARLPSAMPDLRAAAKNGPPTLHEPAESDEEEELDVLEIEPTPLWKRALIAALVALFLGGVTSVVVYPDMYKGLFSTNFFNFSSGPRVSRFASELPQNAPPPKPKINPAQLERNNAFIANEQETGIETADTAAANNNPVDRQIPVEQSPNPQSNQASETDSSKRPQSPGASNNDNNRVITSPANGTGYGRRFKSERPGAKKQPAVADAAPPSPATADNAIATVAPRESSPIEPMPRQSPVPVKQTLIRLPSLEAVSFSPNWDFIESSRSPIPIVVATHDLQSAMGIKFDLQPSPEHRSTAPDIARRQVNSRRWDITVASRAVGYFQVVDTRDGSRLEFQCNLDNNGDVDALADDIECINRCQIRVEYADEMATVFPLDIEFVHGHIGLDNKRRNNEVTFAHLNNGLDELLEDKSLKLVYDVHGFSTSGDARWDSVKRKSPQTENVYDRQRKTDNQVDQARQVPHALVDFALALTETAFEPFSLDEQTRLRELNPRLRLIIYKLPGKPLRYKWHAFIVDAPETPGVELQSWRFTNHPLRVIGRDYKKRKSALRTSGGDEKLIDVVTAEIDFLEKVYKKTAKTLRVDELMPGMIPHPIEIRGDGLSMLMYIDMGNIGKQWSAAEMKRAFHGSPIETATE